MLNTSQATRDAIPSPTVSASRKKPRTSQTNPSLALGAPPPMLHQEFGGTINPSPTVAKRGAVGGSKGKKTKSVSLIFLGNFTNFSYNEIDE